MNINRVNAVSFGEFLHSGPYYDSIRKGEFAYNSLSSNPDYRQNAIYSMLEVIRDEQREQTKVIAQNQQKLMDILTKIGFSHLNYGIVDKYINGDRKIEIIA